MQRDFNIRRVWFVGVLLLASSLAGGGVGATEEQGRGHRSKPVVLDALARGGATIEDRRLRWRPGEPGRRGGILGMLADGREGALAVPISRDVSFGFGYEYVTPEDLAFELAATGSLTADYESHEVMIRAAWRF